eukprot:CAMPEP_0176149036 /NCGR_PEP_ID=MMETSP0120_2-20121206/76026_1 /TAXON_ID=160619 /ORGANISM="Kryptoperidinium foliaceum, Strain CCMP 1326" /LENGTH=35 /DNA_ID= /DNA_START= /DNA_END= /DNA_ORIENTATION=
MEHHRRAAMCSDCAPETRARPRSAMPHGKIPSMSG